MTQPSLEGVLEKLNAHQHYKRIFIYLRAMRARQWIKNLVVFTAITFAGKLFQVDLFVSSLYAFFVFCMLSSTSYLLNDVIDFQYDRKHPVKRYRPIASGQISIAEASFLVFVLALISLVLSVAFSLPFALLSVLFLLLHVFYSLYLKKHPVIDIFTISFSFMVRAFAGEVATGYHIPIWLLLTIFFGSLFMATIKRHAELVRQGTETRESLDKYKGGHFLEFLTQTFATTTILAYSNYTYVEQPPATRSLIADAISKLYPDFEARKYIMITIPLVVYGIARYAQLLYEKTEGERPEHLLTSDKPLLIAMFLWAVITIGLIYVF